MPILSANERKQTESSYQKLYNLIEKRQEFEAAHPFPPYSLHRTDINFTDISGHSLLHYAAMLGDLAQVQACLAKKEVDINLKNSSKISAIGLALSYGHLEVAKELYSKGAQCQDIALSECVDDNTRVWFVEEIRKALYQSYPNPEGVNDFTDEDDFKDKANQFFSYFSSWPSALWRATEIADLDYLKAASTGANAKDWPNYLEGFGNNKSLLIIAVENGLGTVADFLLKENANINEKNEYAFTPLMAAIKARKQGIIDFLLAQKVNINKQDTRKQTALHYALMNGDLSCVKRLISLGADLQCRNLDGRNILHTAVRFQPDLIGELLAIPGVNSLTNHKDIYGFTPFDLAIQDKNDEIIRQLSPATDLESLKRDPKYGVQPPLIKQRTVDKAMLYYLKLRYRDTIYFSTQGNCNGYSFLKPLYTSRGMEAYYFDTLAKMSSWDGEEASLIEKFLNIPQAEFYPNLDALFDRWAFTVIWFQHTTLSEIDELKQDDHLAQYLVVEDKREFRPYTIYHEKYYYRNHHCINQRTPEQVMEMLTYLYRMPPGIQFQISGTGHVTSGSIDPKNIYDYYDPNFMYATEKAADCKEVMQRIINYKYILLNEFNDKISAIFMIYAFQKVNLTNFELFKENELPKSKEDSLAFQQNSPNGWTPLHLAMIMQNLSTVKRLIADGHCDINAKDFLKRTAFEIALDSNFVEGMHCLLATRPAKDLFTATLAIEAYNEGKKDVLQVLLDASGGIDMTPLLRVAINKEDTELVEKLLTLPQVNVNDASDNNELPLIEAIQKKNVKIMTLLLEKGAQPTILNADYLSPLAMAMKIGTPCVMPIVKKLTTIDQVDDGGDAAIHIAALYANWDTLSLLIQEGANLRLLDQKGKSVLDLVGQEAYDEELEHYCLSKLLEVYPFNVYSTKDKETLIALLKEDFINEDIQCFCLKQLFKQPFDLSIADDKKIVVDLTYRLDLKDDQFNSLLAKFTPEMVNLKFDKDEPLLLHLIRNKQIQKTEQVIVAGADVNVVYTNSGNSPLMVLIRHPDYPQRYELIKLLIEHKADITIKNKKDKTAIDLINESDDETIKRIFYEKGLIEVNALKQ